ncbi:hypothetical protein ECANGB1_593 [Enterospora canceri]|uniref:Uncharacterized protein n=1 Tax=Enterospora canceri TaxID=1081671 RepID=A0A1Y1S7V7_9MICR|nr:hypothetical protein ECANGB1_593 [Enterospora canceri]
MFKAINTELENMKTKIDLERSKIEQFYNDCLDNKKYVEYFRMKPVHEENLDLYEIGKSNLLCHYVMEQNVEETEQTADEYGTFGYKEPLFEYIYKLVDCGEFERALFHLKRAEKNKWSSYAYFDILDTIKSKYYNRPL